MGEHDHTNRMLAEAAECAAWLLGTVNMLETSRWEEFTNDPAFCTALDDRVFLCEECGWWCATEEMTEPSTCDECHPEDADG